jgi:hypothetical protein
MKIIITESQFGILTENKVTIDNLVKITKLTQSDAEMLYATAGKLSMWIAKKIKDKRIKSKIEKITGIVDWIRVGLNGNIQTIKNVDFDTLVEMQETWHKSLKAKEYDFEYDDIVEFVIRIMGSIEMIRFIFELLCESWNKRNYFLKIYKRIYHKKQKDSILQFFSC